MILAMSKTPTVFRHVPVDPRFTGPGVAVEVTSDRGRSLAVVLENPSDGLCAFMDRLHPNEDARVAVRRVGAFAGGRYTDASEVNALMAVTHGDARPGAAEAFAAAGISGAMRQALELMFGHRVPKLPDWLRYARHRTGKGLWDFVVLGLTHPVLYDLARGNDAFLSGLLAEGDLGKALGAAWPKIRSDHVRGLSRERRDYPTDLVARDEVSLSRTTDAAAEAMFALPSEWMPGTRAEWEAFAILASASEYAIDEFGTDHDTLLAPGRGDWAGYLRRISASSGLRAPREGRGFDFHLMDNLDVTMTEAFDPPTHLANTVVMPLLADPCGDDDIDALRGTANRVAAGWLYGRKSLNEILRASRRWHAHQHAIDASIMGSAGNAAWAPLIPDQDMGNGIRAVVITDRRSLVAEGAGGVDANGAAGLDHCVATYLPKARRGACHVVSIRRVHPDGSYDRMATAELALSRDGSRIVVEQAKARSNADPSRAATAALEALVDAINAKRIPIDPEVARVQERTLAGDGDEGEAETLADACGYDWGDEGLVLRAAKAWSPLLPRDIRDMDVGRLRQRARRDAGR